MNNKFTSLNRVSSVQFSYVAL